MNSNLKIAYILAFCKNTWFWLGVWVFYYLMYTNYTGIGLIEMSLVVAMTISEIPTGAIADLVGKKKTLFISFLLQAIGGFIMAFAPQYIYLVIAVFIMGVGGAFYSGTLEALIYDSLKEIGQENIYDKIISRVNAISLVAPAVCGLIGSYMYLIKPNLPFLANSLFYILAVFLCIFLKEPRIEKETFSFNSFVKQTKIGLSELFKSRSVSDQTILLLSIGVIIVICDEMLNSFLGVEFKFNPNELGILWSISYVIAALASHLSPQIRKFMSYKNAAVLVGLLIAITLILSPLVGMVFGGISLLLRSSFQAMYGNYSSVLVNELTESNKRATTLSTFNLLKNIPYVLLAYTFGILADKYTAINIAVVLGSVLMMMILLQGLTYSRRVTSKIFF